MGACKGLVGKLHEEKIRNHGVVLVFLATVLRQYFVSLYIIIVSLQAY